MIRWYIGKRLRLPIVGSIYTGVSMPVKKVVCCDGCGRPNYEAAFVIGFLLPFAVIVLYVIITSQLK